MGHGARGAGRQRRHGARRLGRPLHPDARRSRTRSYRATGARSPASTGCRPHRSRRRHRRHPVAQPARRRRLQVQPAARRPGRHRRHEVDRRPRQRADRRRPGRGQADAVRPGPGRRQPAYDFLGPYVDDLPSVLDLDAIRAAGRAHRRRPAGRRERGLLGGDRRAARARSDRGEPAGRPDLAVHDAGLGRQDPDGLLVAVRDGLADRAARRVRHLHRQRRRRRPARHRHPRRRADEPQPLPRRRDLLPLRHRARGGRDDGDRQDAGVAAR